MYRLGVIGDPVSRSLSPLIHNGWFSDLSVTAHYEAFQVPSGRLEQALQAFSSQGILGLNVTLPHKIAVLKRACKASKFCLMIGAANMLTCHGEKGWAADNTDSYGFLASLKRKHPRFNLENRCIMVLGAGGAARAVVHALHLSGASLVILNRSPAKAFTLNAELCNGKALCGPLSAYSDYVADVDMVVNTTSIGHTRASLQPERGFDRVFYDISYAQAAEKQLYDARMNGWQTMDGLGMLVAQAMKSFTIWFGKEPDFERALRRCRRALGQS